MDHVNIEKLVRFVIQTSTVAMTRNTRDTMCPPRYGRKYVYMVYWGKWHHNCK